MRRQLGTGTTPLTGSVPGVGFYEWDVAADRLRWSPELVALYGLTAAPDTEHGFGRLVHPDDRTRVEAETSAMLEAGETYVHTFRIVRPDGRVRTVLDRGSIERDAEGRARLLRGVNVDITDLPREGSEEAASSPAAAGLDAERLRLASRAAAIGVYDLDLATERSYWSPELVRLLGLGEDAMLASVDRALETVHPDDRVRVRAAMAAALRRIGRFETEFRVLRSDGEVRWVQDRGETFGPVHPDTGCATRVAGVLIDVTERHRAEEALRETTRRLELAYEATETGAWDLDLRSGRLVWTPIVYDLLGAARDSPASVERFFAFVHPDDRAAVRERFETAIATREPFHARFRVVRADGIVRHLVGKGRVVGETDGAPSRMIGFNYDVTEDAEARARLAESEARLRLALDAGRMGTWSWRPASGAVALDDRAMALLGLDPAAFDGTARTLVGAVRPEDAVAFGSALRDALAQHAPFEHEIRVASPDGATRWIASLGRPERDGRSGARVVRGVLFEVTERRRAEERARLLLHELDHRTKNLLTLVQAVARQTAHGDRADFLARFEARIGALAEAQNLLVRGGRHGVALDALARAQLGHFADLIGTRIRLAGPAVELTAHAAQALGMALHELATNASKYGALSTERGRVEIAWSVGPGAVGARRFAIAWVERGGPPVTPPAHHGFGTTMIERMARASLNAEAVADYAPEGFAWRLACAVEDVLVDG